MGPVMRRVMRAASALNTTVYRRSGGRRMNRAGGGVPVLLLTTTGRRTGQARTKPVGYVEVDGVPVVCGSAGGDEQDPAWVLNLRAEPRATVQLGERTFPVVAEEVGDDEYGRYWEAFTAKQPNFAAYQRKTSRRLPLVRLVEVPPAA